MRVVLKSAPFIILLLAGACAESGNVLSPGAGGTGPLSQSLRTPCTEPSHGTVTIDGRFCPGEWTGATQFTFAANTPEGDTSQAAVFVRNDGTNLYVAVRIRRSSALDGGGQAVFEFDNDGDGILENGNDVILHGSDGNFFDDFRTNAPPCTGGAPGSCAFFDTSDGGTNDGAGAYANDGVFAVYELAHPLNSTDDSHDFSLAAGQTLGLSLQLSLAPIGGGNSGQTLFPGPSQSDYTLVTIAP